VRGARVSLGIGAACATADRAGAAGRSDCAKQIVKLASRQRRKARRWTGANVTAGS